MGRWAQMIGVAACVAAAGFAACQKNPPERQEVAEGAITGSPERVLATVGEVPIRLGEVDRRVRGWKTAGMSGVAEMTDRDLQERAIESLIDMNLLLAASRAAGMTPTQEQVEQVLETFVSQYPTTEDFKRALDRQKMTEETLRADIYSDMAIRQYFAKTLPDTIQVSPEESRRFYAENPQLFESGERLRARHILIRAEGTDLSTTPGDWSQAQRDQARKEAESILGELRQGSDFATLARRSSDCPSASGGGALDPFGRGDMVKPFEDAAFALPVGELSEVVETRFGYHVLLLEERLPSEKMLYDPSLEGQILQRLHADKHERAVRQRIVELRASTQIERKL